MEKEKETKLLPNSKSRFTLSFPLMSDPIHDLVNIHNEFSKLSTKNFEFMMEDPAMAKAGRAPPKVSEKDYIKYFFEIWDQEPIGNDIKISELATIRVEKLNNNYSLSSINNLLDFYQKLFKTNWGRSKPISFNNDKEGKSTEIEEEIENDWKLKCGIMTKICKNLIELLYLKLDLVEFDLDFDTSKLLYSEYSYKIAEFYQGRNLSDLLSDKNNNKPIFIILKKLRKKFENYFSRKICITGKLFIKATKEENMGNNLRYFEHLMQKGEKLSPYKKRCMSFGYWIYLNYGYLITVLRSSKGGK